MMRRFTISNTAALLVLIFLCLEFFSPVLFQGKTFFYRDLPMAAYPMKHFLFQAYHEGFLPFWNPALFCGLPFMANLHPGVFYPPSLIFFLNDFISAFNWYFVLHHLFLTLSVFALCRYWKLSVGASLCSAVTAFAGGYFLSLMNIYNHYQSVVWVPSIFLFFQKYLQSARTRDFLAALACLTCQTLAGSPENSILTVLLLYGHSVFVVPAETRVSGFFQRALALGAVVLLSLGLTAVQLLPTYALIKESVRGDVMIFADHAKWSLKPLSLATLLLPTDFLHFMERTIPMPVSFLQSLYMGILPAIFLCLGIFSWKERAIRFWTVVFFAGIFLALGKYNPLYEFLYRWTPFLGTFRYPEKFYFLSAFSLVFLVGHGLDATMRRVSEKAFDIRVFFGVLLLLGALGGVVAGQVSGSNVILLVGFLLLFGFCWSMFYFQKLGGTALKVVLFALILSDLVWKHYMLTPMIDNKFFQEKPQLLQKIKEKTGFYRTYSGPLTGEVDMGQFVQAPSLLSSHVLVKEGLRPNMGMIYGLSYANGMAGVELRFISLWYEIFKHSPSGKRRRILERSNVKYQVLGETLSGKPKNFPQFLQNSVVEFDNALPRAFLVPKARIEKYPHLINLYYDASFDPRKEVLLSEAVAEKKNDAVEFQGAVVAVDYQPNRVRIRTRQNSQGYLVLVDTWFPGWKVVVDSEPGQILRANYFYRAVQLDAGEHTIEFFYEPRGFKLGVFISIGTLLIILAGLAMTGYIRGKTGQRKPLSFSRG